MASTEMAKGGGGAGLERLLGRSLLDNQVESQEGSWIYESRVQGWNLDRR